MAQGYYSTYIRRATKRLPHFAFVDAQLLLDKYSKLRGSQDVVTFEDFSEVGLKIVI